MYGIIGHLHKTESPRFLGEFVHCKNLVLAFVVFSSNILLNFHLLTS